jgi:hypothetical protein
MGNNTKKGLLVFLMLIVLLPMLQKQFNIINSGKLYGYYTSAPDTDFDFTAWWRGTYQEKKEKYLNDHVGFRQDFIRLTAQVDFSLFNNNRFGAEAGTSHCLWFRNYIDAYLGRDYSGYQPALERLYKLKKLQDTLARLGKTLIVVHAPSKGYYYPEYLPEKDKHAQRGTTNLETYTRIGDSLGINQIDFNAWFLQLKHTSRHLLYPLAGTHWSVYGATLAADSLVKYMEAKMHISMPHFWWTTVTKRTDAQYTDDDLAKPLNLMFPYCRETYSYPDLHFSADSMKKKPKVVYIGDSFMCQWLYLSIPDNINDNYQYWCRFDEVCNQQYPYGSAYNPRIKDINWIAVLESSDCVIFIYTAIDLPKLGHGFIEQAYAHYFGEK